MNEFVNLNSRTKDIEIKTKIQGKEVKGTFTVKFPSILDTIDIEVNLAKVLKDADLKTISNMGYTLAASVCYLNKLLVKTPDWFDMNKVDNPDLIYELYAKAREFENSFRKQNGEDEPRGDSPKSDSEEVTESEQDS